MAGRGRNLCVGPVVCAVVLAIGSSPVWSFPLNGGFEDGGSRPVGWSTQGAWRTHPLEPFEGVKCLRTVPKYARAGDRATSGGYYLMAPGERLSLRLAYIAQGEGAQAGLQLCDELGEPVGREVVLELPPAEEWRETHLDYLCGAEGEPAEAKSVRVFLSLASDELPVMADAVVLEAAPRSPEVPPAPRIDPLAQTNLLSGQARWQLMAATEPTITVGDEAAIGAVPLPCADRDQAWMLPARLVDGAYPYRAGLCLPATAAGAGMAGRLIVRLLTPDGREVVAQAETALLTPAEGSDAVDAGLVLAGLYRDPTCSLLQFIVTVPGTEREGATFPVGAPQLGAVPISLSLRGEAARVTFESPESVRIYVAAENNTRTDLVVDAQMLFTDANGAIAHRENRSIGIGARSLASFPVKPALHGEGNFNVAVRLVTQGGVTAAEGGFRFAVAPLPARSSLWSPSLARRIKPSDSWRAPWSAGE